jgi:hypothetical protein
MFAQARILLIVCFSLTLAGCVVTAETPTPLPTSVPTQTAPTGSPSATPEAIASPASTEAPTATPSPTVTASPTIEPSPTTPPTPDPNLNVTDTILYADNFDGKSGWFWTFADDVAQFEARDGQLNVATKQTNGSWRFVYRDDVKGGDQQLLVTAKVVDCSADDEYGLLFRGQTQNEAINTYVFKLNCNGAARVERLQGTDVFLLKDWQTSPAIRFGPGAENKLVVWAQKDQFNFYANDQYLFSLTDSTLAEGFYGFYLRDVTAGTMSLAFTGMVVKEVKAP